jgi:hypothetical protein
MLFDQPFMLGFNPPNNNNRRESQYQTSENNNPATKGERRTKAELQYHTHYCMLQNWLVAPEKLAQFLQHADQPSAELQLSN